MKTIYFFILISPFFLSCNSDNETTNDLVKEEVASRLPGEFPANPDNAYDVAGQLYYDVSESYLAGNYYDEDIESVSETVELILSTNAGFQALKDTNYSVADANAIEAYLAGDTWMLSDAIATSGLGLTSQQALLTFLTSLHQFEVDQKSFDVIYPYITNFEKGVGSSTITAQEKKTVLTISSIMRYSFYFSRKHKQKPRDRNWDITMACLIATVEGTKEGLAKSITVSAITGIAVNNY